MATVYNYTILATFRSALSQAPQAFCIGMKHPLHYHVL